MVTPVTGVWCQRSSAISKNWAGISQKKLYIFWRQSGISNQIKHLSTLAILMLKKVLFYFCRVPLSFWILCSSSDNTPQWCVGPTLIHIEHSASTSTALFAKWQRLTFGFRFSNFYLQYHKSIDNLAKSQSTDCKFSTYLVNTV